MQLKVCSVCKVEKKLEEFTANKNQPSGYMGYCKDCNNERNKRYRKGPTTLNRACKRIFSYLTRRCRVKGFDLDISVEYLEELFEKQNGLCLYTNEPLELSAGKVNTLSVDRIDSSKGYVKENIALTTWQVNNCKQDLSLDDFISLCEKVYKNGKK